MKNDTKLRSVQQWTERPVESGICLGHLLQRRGCWFKSSVGQRNRIKQIWGCMCLRLGNAGQLPCVPATKVQEQTQVVVKKSRCHLFISGIFRSIAPVNVSTFLGKSEFKIHTTNL